MNFDLSTSQVALMPATQMPASDEDGHSWIHLLPAGQSGVIKTHDGRGPYKLLPAEQIIANSRKVDDDWPVDENHAIDKAAPRGEPSPACGRIVEMQSRKDGIWGRVEWNGRGKELIEGRAYKWISPVILHTKDKTIAAIARASLVHTPNLSGMIALHHEDPDMGLLEKLREMLKLADDADQAAVETALQSALDAETTVATQAQLDILAGHLKLETGATIEDLTAAAQSQSDYGDKDDVIAALQSSVKDLGGQLTELTENGKRTRAETYVDGELERGRAGLNATVRDQYVTMHMADPKGAETLISAMPVMTGTLPRPEPLTSSLQSMQPGDIATKARAYQAKQAEAGVRIDIATAITHLEEGKS